MRELRKHRQWTQAELASRLGVSQGYLSAIEHGEGSLAAEQFLEVLKLFNVSAAPFLPRTRRAQHQELQNGLARHGATHLQQSEEVVAGDRYVNVAEAIQDALANGEARFVTSIAPVIVKNADHVNLRKIDLDLARSGLERRLSWVADSTLQSIQNELETSPPRDWARRCRRAEVVLDNYLNGVPEARRATPYPDILDPNIRSKRRATRVGNTASDTARRWGIITSIQGNDFTEALKAARAD